MQGIIALARTSLETLKGIRNKAVEAGGQFLAFVDAEIAKYEALIERLEATFAATGAGFDAPTGLFGALPPADQEWVADLAAELREYAHPAE